MTAPTRWLRPGDIAAELEVTTQTARKIIRRVPGAEMLYRTDRGSERWRVTEANWRAWRASFAKSSKVAKSA